MNGEINNIVYHVLLIGIDRYPPGYNSLFGCVNDIDAIENLIFDPPGIGLRTEQIEVTRLAAPHPERPSISRFQAKTLSPTKANIVAALKKLATTDVKLTDRVLIYYSGHGDEVQWKGSSVWHEALVPHDGQAIEYLFDTEVNGLIKTIAERTSDLTIVLDCCHSAGATRDLSEIPAQGAIRALKGSDNPVAPPDLNALGLASGPAGEHGVEKGLLQTPDSDYMVVVACQSDEKAGEGPLASAQLSDGVFTHSFLSVLSDRDATQRVGLRWADIWPELLANAAERNARLNQRTQHPWMIGRSERKVFGGSWEKMDPGIRVTRQHEGDYEIGAGRLMGVTEGAEIAIYGPVPPLFPPVGSPSDKPVGRLKVSWAGPSSAIASTIGAAFALPEGARGRMTKPGESQRLQVSLKPENEALKAELEKSPLLKIVSATTSDAEVEVIEKPGGGWIIANDMEPMMATVPADETRALCAGLEFYYRYNTVLRMARNCNDPQISHSLSVRLFDCNDQAALKAMSPERLADPELPEAPRDQNRIYALPSAFKFCVKVDNSSPYPLNVTLLNCSSGGMVQYLSDALLRKGASHVMWLDNKLGVPFEASPDELPAVGAGVSSQHFVTDRVIAIGTTHANMDLRYLCSEMDKTVQMVVDENLSRRGPKGMRPSEKTSTAPAELWTATIAPVRIYKR